jgi:hypothetical protein
MDNDVQRLLDIEAIKQLKARYCLLLDAQEWDQLRTLFTDKLRAEVGSGNYDTADAFVDRLRANLTGESHVHYAYMPIIELAGPGEARGLWAFSNRGALGHYQEEYTKRDGGWKISAIKMTWIYPPNEELLRTRKGAFPEVADHWHQVAAGWSK